MSSEQIDEEEFLICNDCKKPLEKCMCVCPYCGERDKCECVCLMQQLEVKKL